MSPQWLLRLTRGGFVGFLARWWWGRRRAGAPLRLWLRRAWVAAVADRATGLRPCGSAAAAFHNCCESVVNNRLRAYEGGRACNCNAKVSFGSKLVPYGR